MGSSANAFWKPPKAERKLRPVTRSGELMRVRNLPRRDLGVYDKAFAEALSLELVRPGSTFRLRPMQAAMLVEAVEAMGVFGLLGVGYGKTVCSPLFGKVLGLSPWVLLVPPAIKREIEERVIPMLRREIDGIVVPHVVSYHELSTVKTADVLDRLQPKLIVADEAHNLRNKQSSRWKRFDRYFDANPDTVLVALSGTMMRKSVRDMQHIVMLTHKSPDRMTGQINTPLTRSWKEIGDWALALDPQVKEFERLHPGALLELRGDGDPVGDSIEIARNIFRRRLLDTEGVVAGDAEDVGASLIIQTLKRTDHIPAEVKAALKELRRKWVTPSGEQITDALDFSRKARELAQGFYHVWDWPDGLPDKEWLASRKKWREMVSSVCKLNREGLDSELLVRNACRRALGLSGDSGKGAELPKASRVEVLDAYKWWHEQSKKDEPETRAVWISDWLVRRAIAWTKDNPRGIVWFDSTCVGERAVQLGAVVCHAGNAGNKKIDDLAQLAEPPSIFASTMAHGTGKNLQAWCCMLVLAPWAGGGTWTQVIGREHRPGQLEDEVRVDVYAHTIELCLAIDRAMADSKGIEENTGTGQKMTVAQWINVA